MKEHIKLDTNKMKTSLHQKFTIILKIYGLSLNSHARIMYIIRVHSQPLHALLLANDNTGHTHQYCKALSD